MEILTLRTLPLKVFWPLLLSTLPLHAQNRVWVVAPQPGPGVDFTRVQDAVDAAAPRDTVLIRDGYYLETRLAIQKGITLLAQNPLQAIVEATTQVLRLPAGQSLCVQGLRLLGTQDPNSTDVVAVRISQCAGAVSFHGCAFRSGIGSSAILRQFAGEGTVHVDRSDSVVLEDCRVEPVAYNRTGATFRQSQGSILRGRYPAGDTLDPTAVGPIGSLGGVGIIGSSVFIADADISGGDASRAEAHGGVALGVAGSTVWIKAPRPGSIRGGDAGGFVIPLRGGDGLRAIGSTVFLDGMPFVGGFGSPSNPPGPAGEAMNTDRPVMMQSQPLFTRSPARFPRGGTTSLEVEAGPHELHGIVMTALLQPRVLPPGQADPLWVLQSPSWFLGPIFVTDGLGRARIAVAVPTGPELAGQPVWMQDIGVSSNLEIMPSAVLGGAIW